MAAKIVNLADPDEGETLCASVEDAEQALAASACGRKRTLDFMNFRVFERPLSGKADIQASPEVAMSTCALILLPERK